MRLHRKRGFRRISMTSRATRTLSTAVDCHQESYAPPKMPQKLNGVAYAQTAFNDPDVEIMAIRIIGVDPSLTSTGYAFRATKGDQEGMTVLGHIKGSDRTGMGRLVYIEERIIGLIDSVQPAKIIFEGYAMGVQARRSAAFDLGELGGVLKKTIWERGIDTLLVPPTVLKKFITGKGNAKKDEMFEHLSEASGLSFRNTDEADAYGLLLLGERHYKSEKVDGVREIKGRPIRTN